MLCTLFKNSLMGHVKGCNIPKDLFSLWGFKHLFLWVSMNYVIKFMFFFIYLTLDEPQIVQKRTLKFKISVIEGLLLLPIFPTVSRPWSASFPVINIAPISCVWLTLTNWTKPLLFDEAWYKPCELLFMFRVLALLWGQKRKPQMDTKGSFDFSSL